MLWLTASLSGFSGSSVGPAARADILQWLHGTDDGLVLLDRMSTTDDVAIVNRPVVDFDGVDDDANAGVIHGRHYGDWEYSITMAFDSASINYRSFLGTWTTVTKGSITIHKSPSRIYPIFFAHEDAGAASIAVGGLPPTDGTFHTYLLKREGDDVSWWVDGSQVGSSVDVTGKSFGNDVHEIMLMKNMSSASTSAGPATVSAAHFKKDGAFVFQYELEEEAAGTLYDVSGNGNHATINTSSTLATMRAGRDDAVSSYNALNGFRDESGTLVPALTDGSTAANGSALTNAGGRVHAGSDYNLLQTDADYGVFDASLNFWGDGTSTWNGMSDDDLVTHANTENGRYGLWVKEEGGEVIDAVQYPVSQTYSAEEQARNEAFFGGTAF